MVISIHFQCKDLVHSTETTISHSFRFDGNHPIEMVVFVDRCPLVSRIEFVSNLFHEILDAFFTSDINLIPAPNSQMFFWICLVKQQPLFHGKDLGFPSSN